MTEESSKLTDVCTLLGLMLSSDVVFPMGVTCIDGATIEVNVSLTSKDVCWIFRVDDIILGTFDVPWVTMVTDERVMVVLRERRRLEDTDRREDKMRLC